MAVAGLSRQQPFVDFSVAVLQVDSKMMQGNRVWLRDIFERILKKVFANPIECTKRPIFRSLKSRQNAPGPFPLLGSPDFPKGNILILVTQVHVEI